MKNGGKLDPQVAEWVSQSRFRYLVHSDADVHSGLQVDALPGLNPVSGIWFIPMGAPGARGYLLRARVSIPFPVSGSFRSGTEINNTVTAPKPSQSRFRYLVHSDFPRLESS